MSTATTAEFTDLDRRIDDAAAAWSKRIQRDRATAHLTMRATGHGESAVATRVRTGGHEFVVDEPAALAGDDAGPSPVDYALGAIAGCQVVVYRLYARSLGIQVDDIDVTVEGDLDAARLFDEDNTVRAGLSEVRVNVTLSGPASDEDYARLQRVVDDHCPVLDLFANPTPVVTTVTKR